MATTQVTQLAPESAAAAPRLRTPDAPPPASLGIGLSKRTLIQGVVGSVLMLIGSLGAGGDLINDPILGNGPLSWIRYGHGRNLATATLYIGVALLVWAWVRLGRDVIANRVRGRGVLIAGLSWVAPMIISPPQFTRDVFSYLGQGELAWRGLNPYSVGPNVLGDAIAINVHPFWQNTPAPYGPLFILAAKIIAMIVGEHLIIGVILMRLVLMIGLALLVAALPGLTRHLGGRLPVALWLVVASPMMVIHLVGGPHNDLLMIGLLAMGCLLVLDRHHVAGMSLVTLGMAVKATAGVALPFLMWVWAARMEGTAKRRFVRACAATIGIVIVVFAACTLVARVDLGWIPALKAPQLIVNWVNLPTGVGELMHSIVDFFGGGGLNLQPFVSFTRFLGDVLLAVIVARQWWKARHGGADAVRRAGFALLAAAILVAPTLPWYLTWGLAILGASQWRNRWLALSAGIAVLILMVYYPDGEEAMGSLPHMVVVILLALLTMASMLWPDPLRLRRKPRGPGTNLDPGVAEEALAVPLPIVKEAGPAVVTRPEPAMSVKEVRDARDVRARDVRDVRDVIDAAEMPSDLAPQ
ncbi:MAG TPA: polyprenol phosphomannose-dependent alpha 1,6 mannosyltransferase MptB [Pseudonocardiaceae bacterium]|jgi:alpha-1,6-mannosyltransferase|nr:polyprenol phosphomannose-dependent alpha 1,6 mannosyltransferase MptB [Pseudonocardiaceae bacterium]